VNVTEQAPLERMHVSLENLPVLLLDQLTLPFGTELGPCTEVLQVVVEPTTRGARLHDTAIVKKGLS
jgi:hypothetical protein